MRNDRKTKDHFHPVTGQKRGLDYNRSESEAWVQVGLITFSKP